MLKRIVSMLICVSFILCISSVNNIGAESVASASGFDFGDRILYGGTAVDVGSSVISSENGFLYCDGVIIAEIDAEYLNYFDNKLWFVSGNCIMKCNVDGTGIETVRNLGSNSVSCLYIVENGMFYLKNETVVSFCNGNETELFSREGIKGFVPLSDGTFRWVKDNPEYNISDFSGDEVWEAANSQYLSYVTDENGEGDIYVEIPVYGTAAEVQTASDYSGPYVEVGDVTLPLANHMPGTFFSKNGKTCTCHNTTSTYCIESVGNCNCMRYYPTGYKETCEIDLLGAQCFAFSRMVFYTCFGFIDHSMNASLYYSVGSLSSGAVTENSVKSLLMKAAPGAHVRLSQGHSVSILTMDEDFIVIYHGNAGGDGVATQNCVVSTRRYTWEQFARAASAGIQYVNMPYNYPDSEVILTEKEAGYYRLKANLNLRAETNTQSESLAVIPNGTIIEITETDGFWGKTNYWGKEGWVFLEYTTFYSQLKISPSGNVFTLNDDGILRAVAWELDFDTFTEYFDKQSLNVVSADGTDLSEGGYIGTGTTVTLEINGEVIDSATICLAGDINCNGKVDVGDYIMAKRIVMNTLTVSEVQKAAADVSGDGESDPFDYIFIRRFFFSENEALFSSFNNQ